MPERIQQGRRKGSRKPENAVIVSRPSRYGNPFRVVAGEVYGLPWSIVRDRFGKGTGLDPRSGDEAIITTYITASNELAAIVHAVDLFRTYCSVFERDEPERFEAWIGRLRGHDLACFCPPDQPCHADVLLALANPTKTGDRP